MFRNTWDVLTVTSLYRAGEDLEKVLKNVLEHNRTNPVCFLAWFLRIHVIVVVERYWQLCG